jgi:RNA polymerase sigma-70 factor (ECF subfamily)
MRQDKEEDIEKRLRDPKSQRNAFAEIVAAYSEKLYWHIRRMVLVHEDANDILQNTFLKAWLNLNNFRGDAKLSTWMYKIAVNECITFLNKQRAMNSVPLDDTDVYLLQTLKADEYFDGDEIDEKLQKAILSLPEKQRLVFMMKYYEDMKYDDMSEVLGTSVGALKASYFHAVRKIEAFLTNDI